MKFFEKYTENISILHEFSTFELCKCIQNPEYIPPKNLFRKFSNLVELSSYFQTNYIGVPILSQSGEYTLTVLSILHNLSPEEASHWETSGIQELVEQLTPILHKEEEDTMKCENGVIE